LGINLSLALPFQGIAKAKHPDWQGMATKKVGKKNEKGREFF